MFCGMDEGNSNCGCCIISLNLQGIAFVITVSPVFYVCEKAAGVHTNHYFRRILVRVFVVGAHWFVALAVPFFGPINSVLGALLVTVGVYIIPLLAFNIVYRTNKAREVALPSSCLTLVFTRHSFVSCIIIHRHTQQGSRDPCHIHLHRVIRFGKHIACLKSHVQNQSVQMNLYFLVMIKALWLKATIEWTLENQVRLGVILITWLVIHPIASKSNVETFQME